LTGLEWPHELAACVLAPVRPEENGQIRGLIEALGHARAAAGGLVALDSPEFALARTATSDAQVAEAVQDFARELVLGLRLTGLPAVVNLNAAESPAWADDLAEGPLFADRQPPPTKRGPSAR